jgi:TM2 domain-containing membrane protein YozV
MPLLIMLVGIFFYSKPVKALKNLPIPEVDYVNEILSDVSLHELKNDSQSVSVIRIPKKVTAVLLTIALGPFGVHRLYLGTDAKVPVIYTLTLGGGLGVLPLLDIIAIISSPSLEDYMNNTKVVMWAE